MPRPLLAAALLALPLAACRTTRTLKVVSYPPGAVVRLDEEVVGTTPLEVEFVHGGQRRLSLYSDGYRTWSRRVDLELPWYARFPFDLFTEVVVPLGLDHEYTFEVTLTIDTDEEEGEAPAIDAYLSRAVALRRAERARAQVEDEQE